MKKLLCLALGLLLCLMACAALADTEYQEGHFRYAVNEETGEAAVLRLTENWAVVKVPDSVHGYPVTSVASHAFYNCDRLKTVYLPASVTVLGDYAFTGCPELETVQMPGVTTLGNSAFENCGLRSVVLPKTVTKVGKRAFAECSRLYSVQVAGSVSELSEGMFDGCRWLKQVKLGEGVAVIGDKAFCSCAALEEINVPLTVHTLGVNPFIDCVGLKSIKVSADHPMFRVENGALIDVRTGTLVSYAAGQKACSFTVPADVREIGVAAFCQSLFLQEVTVPATVEKVGDYAFWYCTNLTAAHVAEGVAVHPTAFAECYGLVNAQLPAEADMVLPVDPMV